MNFLKNAASHSSWSVQGLYTRIQQRDAMSNIKYLYRNSHLKLTLAFPFRVELLGKYGQSDHFNKQDTGATEAKTWWWIEIQRHEEEGGGYCYHSYHSIGFHDTKGGIQSCWEMSKAEITQSHWTGKEEKKIKSRSECEHWEGKEKRNGETKIKSDMMRKNGTQKSKRESERERTEEEKKQKEGVENELFIPDCFCNIKSNLERPRLEAGRGGWQ